MGFSEDMKIRVVEMIEGSECAPFWLVLGSSSRALYHSLVGGPYHSLFCTVPQSTSLVNLPSLQARRLVA